MFVLLFFLQGKFAQRSNLGQRKYVTDSAEMIKLMMDDSKVLTDFCLVNEDVILVEFENQENFTPDSLSTNVAIAAFTCCWGRLMLFDLLTSVDPARLIYFDTDAIVFKSGPKDKNPQLGPYLGDLTDETEPHFIKKFCSLGPKSYAIQLSDGKEIIKFKGVTLNYQNSNKITFDSMKKMVFSEKTGGESETIQLVNPCRITRDHKSVRLFDRVEIKKCSLVFSKRILLRNLDSVPFGYDFAPG